MNTCIKNIESTNLIPSQILTAQHSNISNDLKIASKKSPNFVAIANIPSKLFDKLDFYCLFKNAYKNS